MSSRRGSSCGLTPSEKAQQRPRKGSLNRLGGFWASFAQKNIEYQADNVFSDTYKGPKVLKKGDDGWGCPTGKTLERGLKAHNHISKEIQHLNSGWEHCEHGRESLPPLKIEKKTQKS